MKKYFLFSALAISILFVSCFDASINSNLSVENSEYMINVDDPFYTIIFNEEGFTFEELDAYYKKIKVERTQEKNYNNLRKIIISVLYLQKDLVNLENKEMLEYYVNELISMPYISDMDMFGNMLGGLVNHWERKKIREISGNIYERNIAYINENFDNPTEILDKQHQKYGAKNLKALMTISD